MTGNVIIRLTEIIFFGFVLNTNIFYFVLNTNVFLFLNATVSYITVLLGRVVFAGFTQAT